MITTKNLTKNYGKTQVLCGISETIEKGEKVVVIGPSGSGKTTIMKLITGEVRPTSGQIIVAQFPLRLF